MIIKSIIFMGIIFLSCIVYSKPTVLAQAGDVKIIQTNCNDKTYQCDYIKTYENKTEKLISEWSKTAIAYQFSPDLIGFKIGATNIPHLLMVYNESNHKQDFFEALMVDNKNKCFITHEKVKKGQYEIKFYRIPSLKTYFVISHKTKGLEDFTRLATYYRFEEDGSFHFNYELIEDDESYYKEIKIMNPCSEKPKVTLVT